MRIDSMLGRLFRRGAAPDAEVRDALANKLARSFDTPPRKRPWKWLGALALGGAVLAGACVVPTDYELAVGMRMVLTLHAAHDTFDPETLSRHLEAEFSPQQLRMMVRVSSDGASPDDEAPTQMEITVDLVGDLDADAVEDSTMAQFPALRGANVNIEALDGTVHGTLGGLITARTFGLQLDRVSVEETRARILADLAARGLEGTATVEIEDEQTPDGHRREIRVRVEAEDPGAH